MFLGTAPIPSDRGAFPIFHRCQEANSSVPSIALSSLDWRTELPDYLCLDHSSLLDSDSTCYPNASVLHLRTRDLLNMQDDDSSTTQLYSRGS